MVARPLLPPVCLHFVLPAWSALLVCAVPALCGTCPGASIAEIASGTVSHAVFSGRSVAQAYDNTRYGSSSSPGLWVGMSLSNWVTFALSKPNDAIVGVQLFAGATSQTSSSGFLTIILSQSADFNITSTRMVCAEGVNVIAGSTAAVSCRKLRNVTHVSAAASRVWVMQMTHYVGAYVGGMPVP